MNDWRQMKAPAVLIVHSEKIMCPLYCRGSGFLILIHEYLDMRYFILVLDSIIHCNITFRVASFSYNELKRDQKDQQWRLG